MCVCGGGGVHCPKAIKVFQGAKDYWEEIGGILESAGAPRRLLHGEAQDIAQQWMSISQP